MHNRRSVQPSDLALYNSAEEHQIPLCAGYILYSNMQGREYCSKISIYHQRHSKEQHSEIEKKAYLVIGICDGVAS